MADGDTSNVDPRVKRVLDRHATLRNGRNSYDAVYQEIKDLVRPDTIDFAGGSNRPEDSRRRITDATAPWSLDQLASGLHTNLSSPVDIWFQFGVAGVPYNKLPFEVKLWLEGVTDTIYAHYSNPSATFAPVIHEGYMDIAAFGTAIIYQWYDDEAETLCFRTYPLAECWFSENYRGLVDTLHRAPKYTVRQVEQEFGDLPPKLAKFKPDDKVTIIHEVCPRKDNDDSGNPAKKKFASTYICKDTQELLKDSGFDWFPYHVPRWCKLSGEVYGRGPALSVMPEIRMLNSIKRAVIISAQKLVDPPLMVEDDGYMLPVRTTPGGINFRRPGAEPIMKLPGADRIDVGVDLIESSREVVRRGFYVDWLVRPLKKERQSVAEITDDRNQMLGMLGPVVGRLQTELLGPMLTLSFNLLSRERKIDPMPAFMDGVHLEMIYVSPAAKAQVLARGQGMGAYLQQVQQLLPIMPGLIYSIDEDALNAELQDVTDAPRRILRSPADAAAQRAKGEQAAQAQQMATIAPAMAKSAKDYAQARQADPGIPALQ